MGGFIFIALPIIAEAIYTVYSLIEGEFNPVLLIIFGIYIIVAFVVRHFGNEIFKKKILSFFLFLILPIGSLILGTAGTWDWYDKGYDANKSTVTVWVYNESSSETIEFIEWTREEKPNTIIDQYYDSIWSIPMSGHVRRNLKKNSVTKFNLRPGTYSFKIETSNSENKNQKREKENKNEYSIDLTESKISLNDKEEIFLCFGGRNFFRFTPDEQTKIAIRSGHFTEDISMPQGMESSIKTLIEDQE